LVGFGELHHIEPPSDEGTTAGGDDDPGDFGRFECGEEAASAGDFDGVGAELVGDEAFDVGDI
jgi:hypothetical protein